MWFSLVSDRGPSALVESWLGSAAARTQTSANMGFQCHRQWFNALPSQHQPYKATEGLSGLES